MMKSALATLLLAAASLGAQGQGMKPVLIEVLAPGTSIGVEQQRLQASDPNIEWIMPVRTDPSALGPGTVAAYLFDRQVEMTLVARPSSNKARPLYWAGRASQANVPSSQSSNVDASLYERADATLGGYINIDGYLYQLRPVDGRQMLVKRDIRRLGDDAGRPLFIRRSLPPPRPR